MRKGVPDREEPASGLEESSRKPERLSHSLYSCLKFLISLLCENKYY